MDQVYSRYICLSTYLKLVNNHTTGRLNAHDNNLLDIIQGPSLWLEYALLLCSVLDSEVSLVWEVEVLFKSLQKYLNLKVR